MKVLIVVPQYKPQGYYYELPLGMAYISSYLKEKGIETETMNLNEASWNKEKIKNSDIICTGGLSTHYYLVKEIIWRAKIEHPGIITIVGGGLISSLPELIYNMLSPYIDLGVVGEGEEIMFSILKNLNQVMKSKIVEAIPILDLDSLPYPNYEGLGVKGYLDRQLPGDEHYLYPLDKPRCLPIISSRSCPYNCSFCFHPTGKKYRQRSLDNFFLEVEYLIERYQINMLSVLDELLSQFPERITLFCERIKKYKLKWMTQLRVDSVNWDTLNMLKDSGCFQISYGIEHTNQSILESYNKKTTLKQIEDTLRMTYEAGIGIQGNILVGGPNETETTQDEVAKWCLKNYRYMVNMTAVIPYPGTDLFNAGIKSGKIDPEKYIKNNCPYVNFSGITLKLPMVLNMGQVLEDKVIYEDDHRGEINYIKAKCPHCQSISEYSGIYEGGTGFLMTGGNSYRIACRNCNQRYDLK